jgi:hypothetical protein
MKTPETPSKETENRTEGKKPFEPVPSARAGDRVLRRRRKSHGFFSSIARLFKSNENK